MIVHLLTLTFIIKSVISSNPSAKNYFAYATALIPHPEKAYKGGEDAFFANQNLFAVSDGIGTWGEYGIDPGLYSKQLCNEAGKLFERTPSSYYQSPNKLMYDSWQRATNNGSATFLIGILDPELPILRISLIGNSQYLIVRKISGKWTIILMSEEHERTFQFPYQLAYLKEHGDSPDMAVNFIHRVQDGDILIMASDGFFENLHSSQILDLIEKSYNEEKGSENIMLENMTKELIYEAYSLSLNYTWESPFSKKAKKYGYFWKGGKTDDITLLVGKIHFVS